MSFRAGGISGRSRLLHSCAGIFLLFIQLCWPAAQSLHEYLEHGDFAAASDHRHEGESDQNHDPAHCQVCQLLAQVRTLDLPSAPLVVAGQSLVTIRPLPAQSPPVAVSFLSSVSPRAPPIV